MDLILESWERHLRAANRSPNTIKGYLSDADRFDRWLRTEHPDVGLVAAERRHVVGYLAWKVDQGRRPASVAHYYRSLQQLYRWLHAEDEIDVNPMDGLEPPAVPEENPDVIPPADLDALMRILERSMPKRSTDLDKFEQRRDRAMILLLVTTGVRVGGLMGMADTDVDLRAGEFTVTEKGRRTRTVGLLDRSPYGSPAEALDRYLRARRRLLEQRAGRGRRPVTALWVGRQGALTEWGLREMLDRRTAEAGIGRINPHRFRHTFAHLAKSAGMSDEELMEIGGWRSAQMLRHYGKSAVAARARESHKRLFDGGV